MKRKMKPELREKLIRASELTPLEPAEVRCLCNECAAELFPEREYKWDTSVSGGVKEPCEICTQRTFTKKFTKRRSPIRYLGE